MLQAINPKNQKLVDKAIKLHKLYDENSSLRDIADDNDDVKLYKKYDKLCEKYFNGYLDIIYDLPKGQAKAIEKFILTTY